MKCAKCGKEITGKDYIHAEVPDQEDIYVHSMPCEWYDRDENMDNDA
jgi:hypothetical protein